MEKQVFAVFVIAPVAGGFAATTRAADRGESGKIGLPGGKVDPGESPVGAAIRESYEEGWDVVGVDDEPVFETTVEGKTVQWFKAAGARKLKEYKEKHRIEAIVASAGSFDDLYMNASAFRAYFKHSI